MIPFANMVSSKIPTRLFHIPKYNNYYIRFLRSLNQEPLLLLHPFLRSPKNQLLRFLRSLNHYFYYTDMKLRTITGQLLEFSLIHLHTITN